MKIFIAQYQAGRTGGGWTFADNFVRGMGYLITTDYAEAGIYFIPSPSMVQREDVKAAITAGKKIVLRLDNAVRNSRNRNTGMSRMRDFCDWADLVIYQSSWAKDYLMPFTKKDGPVILNSVDSTIFRPPSLSADMKTVLYSRFNRDETKNYEVARYWFSRYSEQNPSASLAIVGQFSEELRAGNFDFYNGERFQYWGVLSMQQMADMYRSCANFLYTYFNDACSNSLIEALMSGCKIVGDEYYLSTGGASEIMANFVNKGPDYFKLERMCEEYRLAIAGI